MSQIINISYLLCNNKNYRKRAIHLLNSFTLKKNCHLFKLSFALQYFPAASRCNFPLLSKAEAYLPMKQHAIVNSVIYIAPPRSRSCRWCYGIQRSYGRAVSYTFYYDMIADVSIRYIYLCRSMSSRHVFLDIPIQHTDRFYLTFSKKSTHRNNHKSHNVTLPLAC